MSFVAVSCSFLVLAEQKDDGPFGLFMGAGKGGSLEGGGVIALSNGVYVLSKDEIPKPSSLFINYAVTFTKKEGICKIVAVTDSIKSNAKGDQFKQKYEEIKAKLTKIYLESESRDTVPLDSYMLKDENYMYSLKKKERSLATVWSADVGSSMKNDINRIVLTVNNSGDGIVLAYTFDNYANGCQKELEEEEDSKL